MVKGTTLAGVSRLNRETGEWSGMATHSKCNPRNSGSSCHPRACQNCRIRGPSAHLLHRMFTSSRQVIRKHVPVSLALVSNPGVPWRCLGGWGGEGRSWWGNRAPTYCMYSGGDVYRDKKLLQPKKLKTTEVNGGNVSLRPGSKEPRS